MDDAKDDEAVEVVLALGADGELAVDAEATSRAMIDAILEAREERAEEVAASDLEQEARRIHDVVLGRLIELTDVGPKVTYGPCPVAGGVIARSAAALTPDDVGRRVALMFEGGDPGRPMLLGPIHGDDEATSVEHPALAGLQVHEDATKIDIRCKKAIGLSVGKASFILTPKGKVVIRGTELVSRASQVNRIRGASVKIN